jgi:hypothetical protein
VWRQPGAGATPAHLRNLTGLVCNPTVYLRNLTGPGCTAVLTGRTAVTPLDS